MPGTCRVSWEELKNTKIETGFLHLVKPLAGGFTKIRPALGSTSKKRAHTRWSQVHALFVVNPMVMGLLTLELNHKG